MQGEDRDTEESAPHVRALSCSTKSLENGGVTVGKGECRMVLFSAYLSFLNLESIRVEGDGGEWEEDS